MKVIITTGMPGSGKGEFNQYAADKYGFQTVVMGDCIREEAKRRCLDPSSQNLGAVATEMRNKDRTHWAKKTLEKIVKLNAERILIDGSRNIEEIDYFRQELGSDFKIIAIHSPPEVRYRRIISRGRPDDVNPQERDKRELSWGIGAVIAMVDYIISNYENSTIADLKSEADKILGEILAD